MLIKNVLFTEFIENIVEIQTIVWDRRKVILHQHTKHLF